MTIKSHKNPAMRLLALLLTLVMLVGFLPLTASADTLSDFASVYPLRVKAYLDEHASDAVFDYNAFGNWLLNTGSSTTTGSGLIAGFGQLRTAYNNGGAETQQALISIFSTLMKDIVDELPASAKTVAEYVLNTMADGEDIDSGLDVYERFGTFLFSTSSVNWLYVADVNSLLGKLRGKFNNTGSVGTIDLNGFVAALEKVDFDKYETLLNNGDIGAVLTQLSTDLSGDLKPIVDVLDTLENITYNYYAGPGKDLAIPYFNILLSGNKDINTFLDGGATTITDVIVQYISEEVIDDPALSGIVKAYFGDARSLGALAEKVETLSENPLAILSGGSLTLDAILRFLVSREIVTIDRLTGSVASIDVTKAVALVDEMLGTSYGAMLAKATGYADEFVSDAVRHIGNIATAANGNSLTVDYLLNEAQVASTALGKVVNYVGYDLLGVFDSNDVGAVTKFFNTDIMAALERNVLHQLEPFKVKPAAAFAPMALPPSTWLSTKALNSEGLLDITGMLTGLKDPGSYKAVIDVLAQKAKNYFTGNSDVADVIDVVAGLVGDVLDHYDISSAGGTKGLVSYITPDSLKSLYGKYITQYSTLSLEDLAVGVDNRVGQLFKLLDDNDVDAAEDVFDLAVDALGELKIYDPTATNIVKMFINESITAPAYDAFTPLGDKILAAAYRELATWIGKRVAASGTTFDGLVDSTYAPMYDSVKYVLEQLEANGDVKITRNGETWEAYPDDSTGKFYYTVGADTLSTNYDELIWGDGGYYDFLASLGVTFEYRLSAQTVSSQYEIRGNEIVPISNGGTDNASATLTAYAVVEYNGSKWEVPIAKKDIVIVKPVINFTITEPAKPLTPGGLQADPEQLTKIEVSVTSVDGRDIVISNAYVDYFFADGLKSGNAWQGSENKGLNYFEGTGTYANNVKIEPTDSDAVDVDSSITDAFSVGSNIPLQSGTFYLNFNPKSAAAGEQFKLRLIVWQKDKNGVGTGTNLLGYARDTTFTVGFSNADITKDGDPWQDKLRTFYYAAGAEELGVTFGEDITSKFEDVEYKYVLTDSGGNPIDTNDFEVIGGIIYPKTGANLNASTEMTVTAYAVITCKDNTTYEIPFATKPITVVKPEVTLEFVEPSGALTIGELQDEDGYIKIEVTVKNGEDKFISIPSTYLQLGGESYGEYFRGEWWDNTELQLVPDGGSIDENAWVKLDDVYKNFQDMESGTLVLRFLPSKEAVNEEITLRFLAFLNCPDSSLTIWEPLARAETKQVEGGLLKLTANKIELTAGVVEDKGVEVLTSGTNVGIEGYAGLTAVIEFSDAIGLSATHDKLDFEAAGVIDESSGKTVVTLTGVTYTQIPLELKTLKATKVGQFTYTVQLFDPSKGDPTKGGKLVAESDPADFIVSAPDPLLLTLTDIGLVAGAAAESKDIILASGVSAGVYYPGLTAVIEIKGGNPQLAVTAYPALNNGAPIVFTENLAGNYEATLSNVTYTDVTLALELAAKGVGEYKYTLTLKKSDGTIVAESNEAELIVISAPAVPVAPTITTATLPNGTVGIAYSESLSATGDAPITWTIDSGSLPDGLMLDANGTISGTPTTAETATFTVKASNATGIDTEVFSITINTEPPLPQPHEVTFESNGGTTVDAQTVTDGDTAAEPAEPTRAGYDFDGWYTDDGTFADEYDFAMPVTGDFTLYAKWDATVYSISYDLAGGENNAANPDSYTVNTLPVMLEDATLDDYTFTGWVWEGVSSGDDDTYNTIAVGTTGDVSLRATWSAAEYEITYTLNGGDNHIDNPAGYTVEDFPIVLGEPTRDGYDFAGWTYSGSPITQIDAPSTGPIVLVANWTAINYAITYVTDGDPVADGAYTIETGAAALAAPGDRLGYDFDGWYDNAGFTGEAVETIEVGEIGDKEFYANWTPIEYTITYNVNGGADIADGTYTIVSGAALETPAARANYTFNGWYDNAGLTGTAIEAIDVGSTGDIELYASWTYTGGGGGGGGGGTTTTPSPTPEPTPEDEPEEIEVIDEGPILASFVLEHIAYMQGYPDGSVRPDGGVTRAEVAMMLWRLLADAERNDAIDSSFSDVADDAWYAQAVKYLASIEILEGYSDGTFRPDAQMTRAEFVTVMSRFDMSESEAAGMFSDVDGHWAAGYISNAAEKGWIEGDPNGTFRPNAEITRAEAATMINRMLERGIDADDVPDYAPDYTDIDSSHWGYAAIMEASYTHLYYEREADGSELWLTEEEHAAAEAAAEAETETETEAETEADTDGAA
ncbi:MAG: InlB B-repeat-containing protein [Oscillospiraceae bacterium]|nr:InlB B-repeat-containing protein [Oscillospiraceae bacterium]